jgi:hypothetical protein
MRRFAVIEKGKPKGKGRDNFWNATNHLHRACHVSAARGWRQYTTPRPSGGRLPSQPFEFRNQMLECVEILNGRH